MLRNSPENKDFLISGRAVLIGPGKPINARDIDRCETGRIYLRATLGTIAGSAWRVYGIFFAKAANASA